MGFSVLNFGGMILPSALGFSDASGIQFWIEGTKSG
jgi:hypothetical protein